jgi:hypothetical protein
LFFDLTESDVERIASAIFEFYRASFAESEAPRAAVR